MWLSKMDRRFRTMAFNGGLIPLHWGKRSVPVTRGEDWPSYTLTDEINRVFEDFFRGTPAAFEGAAGAFQPKVDLTETESEIKVSAELPGMSEKVIDLT